MRLGQFTPVEDLFNVTVTLTDNATFSSLISLILLQSYISFLYTGMFPMFFKREQILF